MTPIISLIKDEAKQAVLELYQIKIDDVDIQLQLTKSEFEGDITLVVFPLLKFSKKNPPQTAKEIASYLIKHIPEVEKYNIIKGFLNISIKKSYWLNEFYKAEVSKDYGYKEKNSRQETVMIEFSAPNTNKPLHLGHVRNNLLGDSLSKILKANGYKVIKTNLVNDRGIHICKSMYAWLHHGQGATPHSTHKKGDHFVGEYYVLFNKILKQETEKLVAKGVSKDQAEYSTPSMKSIREMLQRWENGDKQTRELWTKMNRWVYEGFDETYEKMGITFDKTYYESDTYLKGRKIVLDGLRKNIFFEKDDNSVWVDLTTDGLDLKLLLRSDGTSVYITQDIGTAVLRHKDFSFDRMIYVVGNEQNYHFHVLSKVMQKLNYSWGKDLMHYSYGMVKLPGGKMKSREGNTVDADDLIADMKKIAQQIAKEAGSLFQNPKTNNSHEKTISMIALGALKYFMLKVDPQKNMLFNPKESIDFNGDTGPFIQYTHARICSVLAKAEQADIHFREFNNSNLEINKSEFLLIKKLLQFPQTVHQAGEELNPTILANYCYLLAKLFNRFYHDYQILNAPSDELIKFRLLISCKVKLVLKNGMSLLGIDLPEKM